MQGDESAAAARRRAFIEQELPELWPTQESMDEAAALRALARRLAAQLEAHDKRPKPMQVPRGTPGPVIERGQMPRPEPVDCGVGLKAPRFGLRSGPLRRGKMPKLPRKVVTYMFPRLRGGMQVEDGELLTGLRSLRGALARGLVPQIDLASARKPVMMEGPPAPPSMSEAELFREIWRPGVVEALRGGLLRPPSVRLRYRSTEVYLPTDWVMRYLREYIESRGSVHPSSTAGVVSGTGFVMDVCWPRYRARAHGLPRRGSYGHMIGCWMLPYTEAEGMPTSLFFQGAGEQRAVHELTMQLLHAYLPFARVPVDNVSSPGRKLVDDDGWCDGLADFIGAMFTRSPRVTLDGDAARPVEDDEAACGFVSIHYADRNLDSLHWWEPWASPCAGLEGHPGGWTYCGLSYVESGALGGSMLLPWDAYEFRLIEWRRPAEFVAADGLSATYTYFEDPGDPGGSPWPAPDDAEAIAAARDRFQIWQPVHLAWDGELLDLLMFMAQVCIDRARSLLRSPSSTLYAGEFLAMYQAGLQFGQYALAVIADRSALLLHEFGHNYLGGSPHCGFDAEPEPEEDDLRRHPFGVPAKDGRPRWRSCFDVARYFLHTQIIAEGGLSVDAYSNVSAVADPDRQPTFTRQLHKRFFRFGPAPFPPVAPCSAVAYGSESHPEPGEDWRRPTSLDAAGCIGSFRAQLSAPGDIGGGYTFWTSNGCSCSAAGIEGDGGIVVGLSTSTSCYFGNLAELGVHFVAST